MNQLSDLPVTALEQSRSASTWEAGLQLRFEHVKGRSFMRTCTHRGPLSVQKPFYPEGPDLAHVYPLHPPGGLVSGDCLTVNVEVADKARLLMTTPGAGRVYRARPDRSWQTQKNFFDVGPDASLEWLPLETILFPDAQARLHSHFSLSKGARLVAWEVVSLGLPATREAFSRGSIDQSLSVDLEGRPMVRERLLLNDASRSLLNARCGFQGQPVAGLMVAGPFEEAAFVQSGSPHAAFVCDDDIDALRDLCGQAPEGHLATVTLAGRFLLIRTLGPCSSTSRKIMENLWTAIRPKLMGRPACPPRIWRT